MRNQALRILVQPALWVGIAFILAAPFTLSIAIYGMLATYKLSPTGSFAWTVLIVLVAAAAASLVASFWTLRLSRLRREAVEGTWVRPSFWPFVLFTIAIYLSIAPSLAISLWDSWPDEPAQKQIHLRSALEKMERRGIARWILR